MSNNRSPDDFTAGILNAHLNGDLEIGGAAFNVAIKELTAGRKESHWIWYVFPQIKFSRQRPESAFYSVSSCDDLRALLEHPIVCENLTQAFVLAANAIDSSQATNLRRIFGSDSQKVASSVTLFAGYLAIHSRPNLDALKNAAIKLRDTALRENFVCQLTLDFLKYC